MLVAHIRFLGQKTPSAAFKVTTDLIAEEPLFA
jgi:hypothetical protein